MINTATLRAQFAVAALLIFPTLSPLPAFAIDRPAQIAQVGAIAPAPVSNLGQLWVEAINRLRRDRQLPILALDPTLAQSAYEHSQEMGLRNFLSADSPKKGSFQDRMWERGVTDASPFIAVLRTADSERQTIETAIRRDPRIQASLLDRELTHIGVGVWRRYQDFVTIQAVQRLVHLKSVPYQIRLDQSFQFEGTLLPSYSKPRLIIARPDGLIDSITLSIDGDRRFSHALSFSQAGRYTVELLPKGPYGPVVTNLFPIYVETKPVKQARLPMAPNPPVIDLIEARDRLLLLLNQERRKLGLSSLTWSPELTEAAQSHAFDMQRNGFFAHVSPYQGDLLSRMTRYQVPGLAFGENIAIDVTLERAHEALMNSPSHREMILHPDMQRVGIGIVQASDPRYGDRILWIVQNFSHD